MKNQLRNVFKPMLDFYESGQGDYNYKASHRTILIVVGLLFLFLSSVSGLIAWNTGEIAGALPSLIFFVLGLVCEVIGGLGTDRAVAKVWGNR